MRPNMTLPQNLKDLQMMKEEMDRLWRDLSVAGNNLREEEIWQWCERLPKSEGVGRKCTSTRSNKTVK